MRLASGIARPATHPATRSATAPRKRQPCLASAACLPAFTQRTETGTLLAPDLPHNVKVLLVEDEPLIREVMAELLALAGFDVIATTTGDEAALLLASDNFTILFTDITMPGMIDGIGLAEHARALNPALPIIFVSGRPENRQRARNFPPPVAFFPKPYDIDTLVGTVAKLAKAAQQTSIPIGRG